MWRWALIFFIAAIIAAVLGLGSAMVTAKTLFFVFLALFLMTLVMGSFLQRPTPDS